MCGIVGFVSEHQKENAIGILRRMLTRIHHRGPDESGVYVCDGFGMGSVRLSIQDIQTGGMPIQSQDGNLWIVFNGEVFNFIELRQELTKKGYEFKTKGDTEVIVNLYQEYGSSFLNKLNGQFAIAIWNREKEELLLARDRIGIRPLFYSDRGGTFLFASEMKAFLEFPDFEFNISSKGISQYFTFWTSINDATVFEGIHELPPGSYMKVGRNGKTLNNYWEIPISESRQGDGADLERKTEELSELIEDSVRLRLRADVPVAAYLSGGLDSTLTTFYINKLNKHNLNTFSIGFKDEEFDESDYQKIASEFFGTKHQAVTIDNEDIASDFADTIWHSEAPLLRTSPVPMKKLSQAVRKKGIKVVITGEGADELFGGYNIFKEAKIRHFWAKDPKSRYRPLLLKRLYPYLPMIKNANSTALQLFFGYKLSETESPIYSHLIRWNNTSRIRNYLSEDMKSKSALYDPVESYLEILGDRLKGADYLEKASYLEMRLFLSGYLLSSQGDRMSMANSVEGRYPFLDYRVMEFAMGLPSEYKIKGLNEKYILKKMMAGKIPESIVKRSKQAYRAPIDKIFLENQGVGAHYRNQLNPEYVSQTGIFDKSLVTKLVDKFDRQQRTTETDRMGLLGVLSVQMLHEYFVRKTRGSLRDNEIIELDKIIID